MPIFGRGHLPQNAPKIEIILKNTKRVYGSLPVHRKTRGSPRQDPDFEDQKMIAGTGLESTRI